MPSANTHDLVTIILAAPTAVVAHHFTGDWIFTAIATGAMIFGGLMFGPDLDIQSRQYTRWGPLRVLWWPYKVALPHRSRLSHGILLGTLIRVIYFLAVVTLLLAAALYLRGAYFHRGAGSFGGITQALARVWEIFTPIKHGYLLAAFLGLWVGASSHTLTDVLGSFFKSIRKSI